ncbi:NAD(P)/FAD-dependent oxidoreductase [Pseudomonadota bacterium AL_CKDN230030165-1A_HGKHYDSX7]
MDLQVDAVQGAASMPARVDVVVIGGGIIGVSTALALARRGHSVAVCEKGEVALEQSSRNWGWVRTTRRDMREYALAVESLRLWRTIDRDLGIDTGFRECGILYAADDAARQQELETWISRVRAEFGAVPTHVLSGAEVDARVPGASRRFAGGIHTPTDGCAEPQRAVPAMARALAALPGAQVLTRCAVRGVDMQGGRVAGVVTERGRIACGAVVVAGGAWSRYFCKSLGIDLPQLLTRGSVLHTQPLAGGPDGCVSTHGVALRKRADGGYTLAWGMRTYAEITPDCFTQFLRFVPALRSTWGSLQLAVGRRFLDEWRRPRRWDLDAPTVFEAVRTLDPQALPGYVAPPLANFRKLLPQLSDARIATQWGGYMDVTPDAIPVIGPAASVPGLFIATGFSGHGFGIGPAAGHLMADLVANDTPLVDPRAFRLERFADGTPIRVDAGF